MEGNALNGKIENLIAAVRGGEEIRVYWVHEDANNKVRKVEHLTDLQFLTIQSGSIVYGQINPIVGQVPDFDKFDITLKENLEWVAIVSSDGNNDTMTRNVVTGEVINHDTRKWATKWFTRK